MLKLDLFTMANFQPYDFLLVLFYESVDSRLLLSYVLLFALLKLPFEHRLQLDLLPLEVFKILLSLFFYTPHFLFFLLKTLFYLGRLCL